MTRAVATTLERTTFETSRAAEYFNADELAAQTGQYVGNFAAVALKELVDNGLDACEAGGISPAVRIKVKQTGEEIQIRVEDSGPGIPPDTVRRILNFNTRTSDKAAYRSPTRGAQGNALKTVLGIPRALGSEEPVTIKARGVKHTIRAWIDPAGELRIEHDEKKAKTKDGTQITLVVPSNDQELDPLFWGRAFSVFNPHATVRISVEGSKFKHAKSSKSKTNEIYHPSVAFPGEWRKFLPIDLTSPWWYDLESLEGLVFSHIADSRNGGRDLTLREFVRQFRGLSGTAKAKKVCDQLPRISRLSDFEDAQEEIRPLQEGMKAQTKAPSAKILGLVGEEHFQTLFDRWYGVKRHWYKKAAKVENGIPFVFEVMVAETKKTGGRFIGLNFSPTYEDPFANTCLKGHESKSWGIQSFLSSAYVSSSTTAVAAHLVCPTLYFLDRGKTRLRVE